MFIIVSSPPAYFEKNKILSIFVAIDKAGRVSYSSSQISSRAEENHDERCFEHIAKTVDRGGTQQRDSAARKKTITFRLQPLHVFRESATVGKSEAEGAGRLNALPLYFCEAFVPAAHA